ncbi:MAG TPA: hypothetical protein VMW19_08115 [Myxococcota bacterium]|nr:hypothetical protein [Myxococcota bacterium]
MARRPALAFSAAVWLAAAAALAKDSSPPAPTPQAEQSAPAPDKAATPSKAAGKPAAGKPEENADHTWYAQALARGAAGLNVTHFWSKGPWLRAETVVAGHKVVNIVKGDWYYAYDGLTKRGLAIRRDPKAEAQDSPQRRPFGREYEILVKQGAEQVGEDNAFGRPVGIYRVTDTHGKREVWVTQDEKKLPLRLQIYDRQTTGTRVTDYVNWQSALAIPDSFFEPEPGIELEKMELEQYLKRSVEEGPVGAVPVLYADLLHGKHEE